MAFGDFLMRLGKAPSEFYALPEVDQLFLRAADDALQKRLKRRSGGRA